MSCSALEILAAEVSSSSSDEEMDCTCLLCKLIIDDCEIMMRLCKTVRGAGPCFLSVSQLCAGYQETAEGAMCFHVSDMSGVG